MTVKPTAAYGVDIELGDGASPEVFTAIEMITEGPDGPSIDPRIISALHHDSLDEVVRVTGTTKSPVTFGVLFDSSNTQHAALVTAANAGTRKNFRVKINEEGKQQLSFAAYIGVKWSEPREGFNTLSVTLTIDGAVSVGTWT